jgi:hypothetical protein
MNAGAPCAQVDEQTGKVTIVQSNPRRKFLHLLDRSVTFA